MRYIAHRVTVLAMLAVLIAAPSFAQRDMGTLLGVVTDPSGAAVPGATITITEDATGITDRVESDATGNFIRPLLKPGTYTIAAESEGFKRSVQTGIQLQSSSRIQANFVLEIGAVTETIEVAGLPPALQTESTQMGGTLEARQTTELPLGGTRKIAFLARTVPGVVPAEPGARDTAGGGFSANGVRSNGQNNFLLNGVDNNVNVIDFINQTAYVIGPSPEAIGEMQIMTNGYGAEYGRAAGGVVNVTIKSGTNNIHGALFEFLQNDAANANTWEANRTGRDKGAFKQNQFGAAVGGPLIKNRTFWFGDYQGTRITNGALSSTLTIPTAGMKAGDFSGIPGGIYDIRTETKNGSTILRDRFVNDMVPVSRFDPIAKKLIDQYPGENQNLWTPGKRPGSNFFTQRDSTVDVDQFDIRLDHRLTDNDSLFGSVSVIEEKKFQSPPLPGDLDAGGFGGETETNKSRNAMMSYTRIWNPTIITETRAAFTRLVTTRVQANADKNSFKELGFGGLDPFTTNNGGLMNLGPSGYSSVGGSNWLPTQEYNNVWDFIQNISINKGSHAYKFGAEFRQIRFPFFQVPSPRGQFNFNANQSKLPSIGNSGDGIATWLLGLPSNGTQLTTQNFISSFKEAYSFYAMDDWKVTSKLTLNIGVRYEITSPIGEEKGRQAHLDWHNGNIDNPILVIPKGKDQDAPLPVNFATDFPNVQVERGIASKYLHGWDKTNIAPRIGLAYEARPGMVIRVAYGIFYGAEENEGGSPNRGENVPFNQQTKFDAASATDINPFIDTFSDGFPLNTFSLPAPISFRTSYPGRRWPLVNKWNVNIQKDLGWNTVWEVGYIGSKGNRLTVNNNPNRPINSPDPGAPSAPRRIVQALGNSGINETNNFGRSTYHALTSKLEKRFSNGLQFLSSYTWGHALSDVGTTLSGGPGQRDTHISDEYAHASFDIRHRLSNSFLYELPFSFDNKVTNALAGGWQMNGIYVLQTGNYFNLGTNNAVGSFGTTRPDAVSGQDVNAAPAGGRSPDVWFNLAGVTDPTPGTFGNLGNYSNIGPPRFNFDFSLFKDFKVTEGTKIQFRAESFNLWNSPQFNNPNSTQGNSDFGRITSTVGGTARNWQFALRFMF